MDTVTHGLLGAAAAQAIFVKKLPRSAALIGAVAGMVPDLDFFLGSRADPVASMLYHRHFTHSLIFIPCGALLTSLLFLWSERFKGARLAVFGAAFVSYGLHGLLDACTSYGTLLLWPFSYQRIAWDIIAIVDPIFTLTVLVGALWTLKAQQPWAARVALCGAALYLGFGFWQWQRATAVQEQLATARGQVIERGRVMPLPGSLSTWRSVYTTSGSIYIDGLRVPWRGDPSLKAGGSVQVAHFASIPAPMAARPGTRRVFEVLRWFADGFVAPVDGLAATVGDMRYAAEASSLVPLWGMQFDASQSDRPVRWRPPGGRLSRIPATIWRTLFESPAGYRPVSEVLAPTPG